MSASPELMSGSIVRMISIARLQSRIQALGLDNLSKHWARLTNGIADPAFKLMASVKTPMAFSHSPSLKTPMASLRFSSNFSKSASLNSLLGSPMSRGESLTGSTTPSMSSSTSDSSDSGSGSGSLAAGSGVSILGSLGGEGGLSAFAGMFAPNDSKYSFRNFRSG